MRKNILVLLNDLVSDYSSTLIEGIRDFCEDKNVNLILANVKTAETISSDSEYPYMTGLKLANSEKINAIIVLSSIFCSSISKKTLTEYLENTICKNIVSISLPLDLPGSVSTFCSSIDAYKQIIKHLHNEHECKNFAFMSAERTGSLEAKERFNSFIAALEEEGLCFDGDLKFEGYFVYDQAYNALKKKYKRKESVNFDAIICASDMMAFGCIDYLSSIGVKIPDDVKVFGYDDIPQASTTKLTLSTVNQRIKIQGQIAAESALKLANGEKVEKEIIVETEPIFRNSCGCKDTSLTAQKEQRDELYFSNVNLAEVIHSTMILQDTYFLLDGIQREMSLKDLYNYLPTKMSQTVISGITICLYDEPVVCIDKESFYIPEKATVTYHFEKNAKQEKTKFSKVFNPRVEIIPDKFCGDTDNTFTIQPICFSNKQYGYLVCKNVSKSILTSSIQQKIFASIIAQSCIYTNHIKENKRLSSENKQLLHDNSELAEQSTTDELTGILNRRGFMDTGQDAIDLSLKLNISGLVCFADMDSLKKINDTYGHEMGDMAIRTQAEILQIVFRKNDIIGRMGGDEFAIVIPGISMDEFPKLKKNLSQMCIKISEMKKLPFYINISIGAVEFDSEHYNLSELLRSADKQQYIEKRKKHAERK